MDRHQIENNLSYHPVTDDTKPVFENNRAMVKDLALRWVQTLPPGRHASLAQTALQEALMWANAAVACDTEAMMRTTTARVTSAHSIQKMDAPGIVYNSFGWALDALRAGRKVARVGWNGKGMHVYLVDAAVGGDVTRRAYISMFTAQGDHVPWVASQSDLLAIDWHEVS